MSFPRYPTYKDSGVEWLGEVPDEWDICEGKRVFCSRRQIALESDPQLAASQKFGVIPQSLMMELNDSKVMLALKGTESFRHVEENDFVISLRSFEGGIEHSNYRGCVSPAYTVLHATKPVESGFFRHLFKSGPYVSALQSTTDSLRDGKSISYQQFGAIPVPLPPLGEQQAIATFLDHETTKIDALVAEQENLIALLKEKRQAVISHAVTKGLDPTVPMKDSGIEWLGEVPAHWEVIHFRRCVSIAEGQVNPEVEPYRDMPLIAPNHIESGSGRILNIETAAEQHAESGKYLCRKGDVIYSKIRPALRKACISPEDGLCSADMYPLRSHSGMSNSYLLWFLLSEPFSAFAVLEADRVAMPKINRESLSAILLPKPSMDEQVSISNYLDTETAKFDDLTTEAQHTVDLLKERRSALISAAVTGKIDVRGYHVHSQPIT